MNAKSVAKPAALLAARRAAPVLIAADLARVTRKHWDEHLTPAQRRQAITLLKESRGRPGNLSAKQRKQLGAILGDFDAPALAKAAAVTFVGAKVRGKRKSTK